MALTTAVVAAVAIALLGNLKFAIAGPDIYSAAPLAAMLSALASLLPQAGAQPQSLTTLLLALTLATILTGAIFYALGALRYANVIRHVPYPVIAGFLSGTGALITLAGVGIVTGIPATVANVAALMEPAQVQKLAVAFGFAVLCALAVRRFTQAITLPALILLGIVGFYLGLRLAGLDLGSARTHGWLFDLDATNYDWRPWYLETAGTVDWRLGDSGERVRIMYLQGFLFFGSAYKLQRQASQLLLGARALILDLQMVESLDSSTCYSLLKLVQLAKRQG